MLLLIHRVVTRFMSRRSENFLELTKIQRSGNQPLPHIPTYFLMNNFRKLMEMKVDIVPLSLCLLPPYLYTYLSLLWGRSMRTSPQAPGTVVACRIPPPRASRVKAAVSRPAPIFADRLSFTLLKCLCSITQSKYKIFYFFLFFFLIVY